MKTFKNTAAQGDVVFVRRKALPENVTPVASDGDQLIVTHSETGHHHVMALDRPEAGEPPAVEMFTDRDNPLIAWLKVNRPTALDHQRPHDTHASILFAPGIYEVRRQREYTPAGWQKVED